MFFYPQNRAQWAALPQLDAVGSIQIPMLLFEIGIDVPGVPLLRFIVKSLKQIPAHKVLRTSGVGFSRS